MDLHAHHRPFGDGLCLDLGPNEALALHGALLQANGNYVADQLLSIIETYQAGGSLERFHPEPETFSIGVGTGSVYVSGENAARPMTASERTRALRGGSDQ
jgi:hypothetical protein